MRATENPESVYEHIFSKKKERKEGQHPVGAYILLLFGFQICFIFFLRSVLASISLAKAGVSTAPLSLLLISLAYLSTEDNVSEHACAHSLFAFKAVASATKESCMHGVLNKIYLQNLFKVGCNFSRRI